jgi:uncharacterized membrane protein YkoI
MIHILKNRAGKFYRLYVVKKGNTFEEMDKSSQGHARKADAVLGAISMAKNIFFECTYIELIDHTKRAVMMAGVNIPGDLDDIKLKASDVEWVEVDETAYPEIKFVQTPSNKRK